MKKSYLWSMCLVLFSGMMASAMAETGNNAVAVVKTLKGNLHVERAASVLKLKVGDKLQMGDRIVTGPASSTGFTMNDDTRISLGSSSTFKITQFAYDANTRKGSFIGSMFKGAMYFVTGLLGKESAQSVSIRSRGAVIGIRGTEFIVKSEADPLKKDAQNCAAKPKEQVILLPQPDGSSSAVLVRPDDEPEVLLDQPYMTVKLDNGNVAVSTLDAAVVNAEFADLLKAIPPGPKHFELFYEFGDIQLTAESKKLFEQVKDELKNYPAGEVVVIGHTDRSGTEDANNKLSLRRAESVKKWLVKLGIPEGVIQTAGRGESEPLVATEDDVREEKNRRVEIKVR